MTQVILPPGVTSVNVNNFPATQPISAASLPLPSGAAQEHVTAGSPASSRLSDGSAFYTAAQTGQLPASLVSGRLDVNIGAAGAGLALPIVGSAPAQTSATWTSATSANTTLSYGSSLAPYGAVTIQIVVPTTVTAGVITLETTADGTNWAQAGSVRVDNSQTENVVPLAYWPGTNGVRQYLISLDALTNVRARLSTVITGSGNVSVIIAPAQQGVEPLVATRVRKVATYSAVFKSATRPYALTNTFTANTRKQYATIFHASSATKTVKIRRVQVEYLLDQSAAAEVNIELVRLTSATTPATGNPAITPVVADSLDAAAEATCLALPTTAGTEGAVWSSRYLNMGITGSASAASPPVYWPEYEMVNGGTGDDEAKFPTIRAGVAEGWALVIDSTTAANHWVRVSMQFTEEAP